MTRKQLLRRMRTILLRRREALQRSLGGELGRFNTSDDRTVGDDADMAVDTDYGYINSQLAENESRELEQIEHALEQMRAGRYGLCDTCGKNIAVSRLQALPYASKCIRCQRATERQRPSAPLPAAPPRATQDDEQDRRFPSPPPRNILVQ